MSKVHKKNRSASRDLRKFVRLAVRCPARIQIGERHYAGYIDNLSEGGVKITTFTPVQGAGNVLLRLPDLPPFRGVLRWSKGTAAGVAFGLRFSPERLAEWAQTRLGQGDLRFDRPAIGHSDECQTLSELTRKD